MTEGIPNIADVVTQLTALVHEFLLGEEEDLHPEDSLIDSGFDSISLAVLISRVNERFGIELDPPTVFANPSPQRIAEAVVVTAARAAAPDAGGNA
ncbi:acyl carrier protein [Streptomyces sp. NPDC005283]|uniref:acyl carrier protein n=1 Tax=Streptomyces sp. NPDC005283 TaxID=3156871 RepID=UPI00345372B3